MHTRSLALTLVASLLASAAPHFVVAEEAPYEQEFIITAYYSPLPDQCCYIRGSFAADMVLNGEGTNGADGTEVYPGMAAAPKEYPFGTRITLPGIGTVAVHDRGGAINVLDNGAHRLDLWVGKGEEGLARALAFGVRRVKATVYPLGSAMPDDHLDLASLTAPIETLKSFRVAEPSLATLRAEKGDKGMSVKLFQQELKLLGYMDAAPNGNFGDATEAALKAFQNDYGILEPSTSLDERTAAFLAVVSARAKAKKDALAFLSASEMTPTDTATLKRVLRYLGFYKGRTTPIADVGLKKAVTAFQTKFALVADDSDPAAGTLGPKTRSLIRKEWTRRVVATKAEEILFVQRIRDIIANKGLLIGEFLAEGDRGADVKKLQQFLADRGYLKQSRVSGTFGSDTASALVAYQVSAGIIKKASDKGSGFAGPATLAQIRHDIERETFLLVRAEGWAVL